MRSWLAQLLRGFSPLPDNALTLSNCRNGGRPSCDSVNMFNFLVFKAMQNFSDERLARVARMLITRADCWNILGIGGVEEISGEKKIWLFQNEWVNANVYENLLAKFDQQMCPEGFTASRGKSVDATQAEAPRSRMKNMDCGQLKEGKVPANEMQRNVRN